MATKYFCDSNSELWYTDIEEFGLELIQMPYILEGEEYSYDCGKNSDLKTFFAKVRGGATPTTSALNEYLYTEIFEPVFAGGDDIFYIAFSSAMSATFGFMQSAVDALLAKYPGRKFTYFDTKSISSGCGIQVYNAMKLQKSGASDEEVLAFLKEFTNHNQTLAVVDDLNHLKRGGRLSGASAFFGTMLNVKPILHITEEGKLAPFDKVKGINKAISFMAEKVASDGENLDKYDVIVVHGDDEAKAMKLKEKILEATDNKATVRVMMIGPVIGAHCGASTLAVSFSSKNR